jgi:hypothetical protein
MQMSDFQGKTEPKCAVLGGACHDPFDFAQDRFGTEHAKEIASPCRRRLNKTTTSKKLDSRSFAGMTVWSYRQLINRIGIRYEKTIYGIKNIRVSGRKTGFCLES